MKKMRCLLVLCTVVSVPLLASRGGRFDHHPAVEPTSLDDAATPDTTSAAPANVTQIPPSDYTSFISEPPVERVTQIATEKADEADDGEEEEAGIAPIPHRPIGSMCANLARRYFYVATHLMTTPTQRRNQQVLKLFCSCLFLMADLADTSLSNPEEFPVRANTYASDIVGIVAAIREATLSEPSFALTLSNYPVLCSLIATEQGANEQEEADIRTELVRAIYSILRTASSGRRLIVELFQELAIIARVQVRSMLDVFRQDLVHLFATVEHQPTPQPLLFTQEPPSVYEEHRTMRHIALLCRTAAHTCENVALVVPGDPYLEHIAPLLTQLNALLSAMAVTYSHLGAAQNTVHRQEKTTLAQHFAHMIHLLPESADLIKKNKFSSLAYCTNLKNYEEQEAFVQESFNHAHNRDALLTEFFTAFEEETHVNIERFSSALTDYTITALSLRLWRRFSSSSEE